MKKRMLFVLTMLAIAAVGAASVSAQTSVQSGRRFAFSGAVYTMSNATTGNEIIVFDRLSDGRLVSAGSVPTGGTGTGGGLGNQGALTLTRSERRPPLRRPHSSSHRLRRGCLDYAPALGWGAVYGIVWWILGGLVLMPVFLGMPAFAPLIMPPMRPVAIGSLVGHLAYGLILGGAFVRLRHPAPVRAA